MATHGLPSTYWDGCRCDLCRDAHTSRVRQSRASRSAKKTTSPAVVPHGLSGYMNWACRCDICKAAHSAYGQGDWDVSRSAEPWDSEELGFVVRNDLPVHEIARHLKRPYKSVRNKRSALRKATS